uniref:Uncharacterized protein n=1 Tax=Anguilla anguilla TaxID=7936 RepID=A0A0E9UT70_ANGAN
MPRTTDSQNFIHNEKQDVNELNRIQRKFG